MKTDKPSIDKTAISKPTIKKTPLLCKVTNDSSNNTLVSQIADIERLIQPLDYWDEQSINDLLSQEINECWVALDIESPSSDDGSDKGDKGSLDGETQVMAYCIWSQVFEVAEILRIGTHPEFQRRGLAEGLIRHKIKQMPDTGVEKILLEVREDNIAAIALYQKIGFSIIHKRKGYYSSSLNNTNERCDALIMEFRESSEI